MHIDARIPTTPSLETLAEFGADAVAAGLIAQCASDAHDARADRRAATERRFAAAEDSIEHARDAARRTFLGGLLGGGMTLVQGAASVASVAAHAGDAPSPTSGTPACADGTAGEGVASAADLTSRRIEAWGTVASSLLGIGKSGADYAASRADAAASASKLEAERAEQAASASGETAQRESSVRDQLTRQLEQMASERHRMDERAMGPQR